MKRQQMTRPITGLTALASRAPKGPGRALASVMTASLFTLAGQTGRIEPCWGGETSRIGDAVFEVNLAGILKGSEISTRLVPDWPGPGTSRRQRELQWMRSHRQELADLAGEWVVVEGEALVAHGKDLLLVVQEAKAKGIRVPFLQHIESRRSKGTGYIGL